MSGRTIARTQRQSILLIIPARRYVGYNSREGNAQPIDETQIATGLVVGGGPGGNLELFGGQASGAGAYPHHRADQDAASYLHLHPLLDADAASYTHCYLHAAPVNRHAHTGGNPGV